MRLHPPALLILMATSLITGCTEPPPATEMVHQAIMDEFKGCPQIDVEVSQVNAFQDINGKKYSLGAHIRILGKDQTTTLDDLDKRLGQLDQFEKSGAMYDGVKEVELHIADSSRSSCIVTYGEFMKFYHHALWAHLTPQLRREHAPEQYALGDNLSFHATVDFDRLEQGWVIKRIQSGPMIK